MTTFIEAPRFPDDISYGSRGGPGWATTVIETDSGSEVRNQRWSYPRHEYDVAFGINTLARLEALLKYFHVVAGMAIGFRYKDWMDYKSCDRADTPAATDCAIGTGTGALTTFQLVKVYTQGAYTRSRRILKPVAGTVLIAVDGAEKSAGTHYNVDPSDGRIVFTTGNIPTAGQAVTAGFEFDVPVRFAVDRLSINLNDYNSGAAQVPLIELKSGDS
ncbi:MAG: DUF2460 domain-containing protein [Thiobacillaceae bacterium]|jgi:uncharacterized protein (TIGR02217 family)|nr:DUF2460 domain-containing protein [Thiobacillaceae bacterium]